MALVPCCHRYRALFILASWIITTSNILQVKRHGFKNEAQAFERALLDALLEGLSLVDTYGYVFRWTLAFYTVWAPNVSTVINQSNILDF